MVVSFAASQSVEYSLDRRMTIMTREKPLLSETGNLKKLREVLW